MENMEYIDDYFKSSPTDEQKRQFEQKIIDDTSFASDVAFYIAASDTIKAQLQEEKKQRFRNIYAERQKVVPISKRPVLKIGRYMAAAGLVAAVILVTWFMTGKKSSPEQLANNYISQNFKTLGVTMGGQDSLQTALTLFNSGKLEDALPLFEQISRNDPSNYIAKKDAGIVSLRLSQYDKALGYFELLAADSSLQSNFGKFYQAVTLLKRNKPGDPADAKGLLKEVVAKDLEGKEEALQWLKKLE